MTRRSRAFFTLFLTLFVTYLVTGYRAYSQTYYQDQEVRVNSLPIVVARSDDSSDVLLASLETLFHDQEICCGKDSALEGSAQAADARRLRGVADKLDGRHLMSDGRPMHITAEFVTPDAVSASQVVNAITDQHALLMQWNKHLYVVCGVDYVRTHDVHSGAAGIVIRRFVLLDTRFADERRNVIFDRETEVPAKVQGLLFLQSRLD